MREVWKPGADASRISSPVSVVFLIALTALAGCSPSSRQEIASPSVAALSSEPASNPSSPLSSSSSLRGSSATKDATSSSKPATSRTLDEMLLFYPSKYPEGDWKPKGLRFEDVWFKAKDGTRLHGWYCPCDRPRAILLFAHGNAGNLSQRRELMRYFQQQLHVTALIFDYRGYGRSEGVPTALGILQDARSARTFLAHRAGVAESQIVLMGRSLGGAVAVQLAAQSPARGLILESTFSSFRDVAAHHHPRLAWLVPADKLDSLAQIKRYQGPLLQSHGDADVTIPYSLGQKLFQTANDPKQWITISGGDHNAPQSPEYYRALDRFVSDLPTG